MTAMIRMMRLCLACCVSAGFVGCHRPQSHPQAWINPASKLSKPISLKDLTTGVNAGKSKPVQEGYLGKWSYFGKARVVQTEQLPDGTISSISVLMEGGEGVDLQNELTAKYSKEEGRRIEFSCDMTEREVSILEGAKVWDEDCTLRHASQILTIHSTHPNNTNLIRDHYEIREFFFSTKLTLVDTAIEGRRQAAVASSEDEDQKKKLSQARSDI